MAWIESHQSLGRHPKLLRLASELRISSAQAIGHLQYLWWWTMDYAENGDLGEYDDRTIAGAAEWTAEAEPFVEALVRSGWLDEREVEDENGETYPAYRIHNWDRYVGRLLDQRETSTKQAGGRARAAHAQRDPAGRFLAGPQQEGPAEPAVQLTVPNRTVPTEPDRTEPNLTEPDQEPPTAAEIDIEENGWKETPRGWTDDQAGLYRKLYGRDPNWGSITFAALNRLNKTFGKGVVTNALRDAWEETATGSLSVHDAFPLLLRICERLAHMEGR